MIPCGEKHHSQLAGQTRIDKSARIPRLDGEWDTMVAFTSNLFKGSLATTQQIAYRGATRSSFLWNSRYEREPSEILLAIRTS